MKLISSPFSSLSRVSDFDEWFRNPFAGLPSLSRFFGNWEPLAADRAGSLATDIHEDKDNYYARFEVPGVKKEDVRIELHNNMLTVSVDKKEKRGEAEASFSYTRSISVPDAVNGDSISAKLEDGMLTVTLPKSEERKPRTIDVA